MIELNSAADNFAFQALHAEAKGQRIGGVVLLQEIFGLDTYMEQDAARYAALGFEVVAPSLFDRHRKGFLAQHDEAGMKAGREAAGATKLEQALGDVQACVDYLKPRGPVFLVGYCYGGWIAWMAAAELQGLSAIASYYGGRIKDYAHIKLHCPLICHFGRKDAHIKAEEMVAVIGAAQPQVPVYVYENSGHGFNNDGRPDSDPSDASLARQRTLDFFRAHGAG